MYSVERATLHLTFTIVSSEARRGSASMLSKRSKLSPRHRHTSAKVLAVVLAVSLFTPELLARYNPKPASPNFYTLDQEVQLGQQAAAEVDKTYPLVNDAELNR